MATERLLLAQQSELRDAMRDMAKGIQNLSTLLARVEERHQTHNTDITRIDTTVSDHERRLKDIEAAAYTIKGGHRALAVVATTLAGVVGLVFAAMEALR